MSEGILFLPLVLLGGIAALAELMCCTSKSQYSYLIQWLFTSLGILPQLFGSSFSNLLSYLS
jgi:hypothetical protein